MIDAQAVSAHLEELGSLHQDLNSAQLTPAADWLEAQLAQLSLEHHRDAAGNHWVTVPGASERTVVLGSFLQANAGRNDPDSALSLTVGLEALKALTHRFDGPPPCTLRWVIWAGSSDATFESNNSSGRNSGFENAVAYLELHLEPGSQLQTAGAPLGVAAATTDGGAFKVHPQLTALCDEAIRELTGTTASLPVHSAPHAAQVAALGIPTAMMYVQQPAEGGDAAAGHANRLHLLQAAEAFGRWAESTVHAVSGDQVDLWAIEHRVPHSS